MASNTSSDQHFKSTATILTTTTIILATLTIILNFTILIRLFYYIKMRKRLSKNNSHRIGLLFTLNTYIHIIGCTMTFLIMSIRTLYGDIKIHKKIDSPASWHCRLLNFLLFIFSAGIYGPSFLHALYRFWRITKPHKHLFQKFDFQLLLIFTYFMSIIFVSIPIWFRSVYIPSENYCLNRNGDIYSSIIVQTVFVTIPVFGIIIVYFKIFLYMKCNRQSRKQLKRIKQVMSRIRRLIFFVIVVLTTALTAAVLWFSTLSQKRLHFLSYRLLFLICQIRSLACSIILLVVSPQLIRALQSEEHIVQRQHNSNSKSVNISNESVPETIALAANYLPRSTRAAVLTTSTIENNRRLEYIL